MFDGTCGAAHWRPPTELAGASPLRVGVVALGGLGGSGRVAHEVAKGLFGRGHHVVMLTSPQAVFSSELTDAVEHWPVAAPLTPQPSADAWVCTLAHDLATAVLQHRLDTLWVHYGTGLGEAAVRARDQLAARGVAIRVCITLHGTDVTHLSRDPCQRALLRNAVLAADGVSVVSPSLARAATRQLRLPRTPLVVSNAVDTAVFRPRPSVAGQGAAPHDRRRVLCHASNFRPVKRPLDCIELLAAQLRAGTDAELVMIGDGPLRLDAEAHARDLGLAGFVTFTGPMPQPQLAAQLRRADVALVTSETESFGMVALEAMASGTVFMGWRSAGLTDLLHGAPDLVPHLLAPLGEFATLTASLRKLLGSPQRYEEIRGLCLNIGRRQFSRAEQLDDYERLLRPPCGGRVPWVAAGRT